MRKTFRYSTAAACLLAMAAAAPAVRAADDVDIDAATKRVAKSLVLVEYTYRSENVSREDSGQGIVLNDKGTVLIAGSLIPEALPKDYVKDIKIRVPGKNFTTVPATFLGRTPDRLFAYVKAEKPIEGSVPLEMDKTAAPKLGQSVFAVALTGKSTGYVPYVGVSRVKAIASLSHDIAGAGSFGLTRGNSPVFDVSTGTLVGITLPSLGESMTMRAGENTVRVELRDDDQSGAFLPWSEVADAVAEIPEKPFDSRRPWLGIDQVAGVDEDMRALNNIDQLAAVSIGAVVEGEPASQAGLQARDIVLTVDGKPFSTTPVPELAVSHFTRSLEKKKIGDAVTLGVLRDGKKLELKAKMGPAPKLAADMPHVFNQKLGIATRDLVFGDKYSRKLPQDTKGVMVALVKQGSTAAIGATPLRPGYLITRVNDKDVADQKEFAEAVKGLLEEKDRTEVVFRVIQANGETMVCRVDLSK